MANKKLYKFLRTGLKSGSGNHKWEVGKWYKEDKISICNSGFHASKTPLQALGYVKGEILAQVEVRGESVVQDDKECWSEMRIVKAYHWKKADSVALAIYAAELVIDIYEKKYPTDKRPQEAIKAAKAYIKNPTAAAAWAAAAWAAAAEAAAAWAAAAEAAEAAEAARAARAALRTKLDKWFIKEIKKLETWTK